MKAFIVTVSDSRSRGEREDTTTAAIRARLAGLCEVAGAVLVADEQPEIEAALREAAQDAALIVTTGGTGLAPRDVTPEATLAVCDRLVPGLAEAVRSQTAGLQPKAWLSRAVAGLCGRTLIVNLPGSPKGVEEALDVLMPLLPHALKVAQGEAHRA